VSVTQTIDGPTKTVEKTLPQATSTLIESRPGPTSIIERTKTLPQATSTLIESRLGPTSIIERTRTILQTILSTFTSVSTSTRVETQFVTYTRKQHGLVRLSPEANLPRIWIAFDQHRDRDLEDPGHFHELCANHANDFHRWTDSRADKNSPRCHSDPCGNCVRADN
jgi:hypothetical protein